MNTMVQDLFERAKRLEVPYARWAREAGVSVGTLLYWRTEGGGGPTLKKLTAASEALDRIERKRRGE